MTHPFILQLKNMEESDPSSTWRFIQQQLIHGIQNIGYAPDSDILLAVSYKTQTLIDCISGQLFAWQEYSPSEDKVVDEVKLTANGIGFLSGISIKIAGEAGGGLIKQTPDGWRLDLYSMDWPSSIIILRNIFETEDYNTSGVTKLFDKKEFVLAYGFSETGLSFVIVTTSIINIYNRK